MERRAAKAALFYHTNMPPETSIRCALIQRLSSLNRLGDGAADIAGHADAAKRRHGRYEVVRVPRGGRYSIKVELCDINY
jgi:hypothetical protein